jgi:hypothetical protein
MGSSAKVQSIEVLKEFRISLCLFVEAARSALGEADADLQRAGGWLTEDRNQYWHAELGRRMEQMQRAKLVLLEKKLQGSSTGARPSCVDEEKAFALAQRRCEEARAKSENAKKWVRRLEEQVFQHKGLLQALNHALDTDVVNALALLDRMIAALDKYIALAPPPGVEPEVTSSEAGGMARPINAEDVEEQDAKPQAAEANEPSTPEDRS